MINDSLKTTALALTLMCPGLLHQAAGQTWTSGSAGSIYYNSGNVGIGTANPNAPLNISGGQQPLILEQGSGGGRSGLSFFNYSAGFSFNGYLGGGQYRAMGTAYTGDILLNGGNGDITIRTGGAPGTDQPITTTTRMLISGTTGSVGIGTTSPSTKLSVVSSGSIDGLTLSSVNRSSIWFTTTGPYNSNWLLQNAVSSNTDFQFLASTTVGGTPTASVMTLLANGNVGIGTTAPQSKLAVNGTITTKEVVVTNTGWADHVFRPAYRLTPLPDVERFIDTNGRLPGIPSEAEVQKTGVSLADMQVKLLAKIEELTLYMIQENKRVSSLEKENRKLQDELRQLKETPNR